MRKFTSLHLFLPNFVSPKTHENFTHSNLVAVEVDDDVLAFDSDRGKETKIVRTISTDGVQS